MRGHAKEKGSCQMKKRVDFLLNTVKKEKERKYGSVMVRGAPMPLVLAQSIVAMSVAFSLLSGKNADKSCRSEL